MTEDYCKFSWDEESLTSQLPFPQDHNATFHVSVQAYFPHGLIHDFASAIFSPADLAERGVVKVPQGSSSIAGDLMHKVGVGSTTQTSYVRDVRRNMYVASKSTQTVPPRNSLIDSLDLDQSVFSNCNTPPNMNRSSPGSYRKPARIATSSKKQRTSRRSSGARRDIEEWAPIDFGLDKRASVRSDPGERGGTSHHIRSRINSNHTSPTSSISAFSTSTDPSHPISIPNSVSLSDPDIGVGESPLLLLKTDSLGRKSHGVGTNMNSPGRGLSKGGTWSLPRKENINKGGISLPKGLFFKEVAQPLQKSKAVGEFVFEYSGGVGMGYYREVAVDVSVLVRPCLLFEQFDVCNCSK